MRIALKNSGTTYWLAGDPDKNVREHTPVSDYSRGGERTYDGVDFIEAEHGDTYDRKNQRNTVSFSTTRKFATAAEADQFVLDYEQNFPLEGTLYFDIDHSETDVREMEGAFMQVPEMVVTGLHVDLEYQVTGRAISNPNAS